MREDAVYEAFINELHRYAGICGHCGKRNCGGREQQSVLPDKLRREHVLHAIQSACHGLSAPTTHAESDKG